MSELRVHYGPLEQDTTLCGRYVYNNEHMKITTDKAEVTCLRCIATAGWTVIQ